MRITHNLFERYVNFEFYKLILDANIAKFAFERYVNFEFYKLPFEFREAQTCLRDM